MPRWIWMWWMPPFSGCCWRKGKSQRRTICKSVFPRSGSIICAEVSACYNEKSPPCDRVFSVTGGAFLLTIFREVAIQWDLIAHTVLQQSLHGIGGLLGHTLRRLDPPQHLVGQAELPGHVVLCQKNGVQHLLENTCCQLRFVHRNHLLIGRMRGRTSRPSSTMNLQNRKYYFSNAVQSGGVIKSVQYSWVFVLRAKS